MERIFNAQSRSVTGDIFRQMLDRQIEYVTESSESNAISQDHNKQPSILPRFHSSIASLGGIMNPESSNTNPLADARHHLAQAYAYYEESEDFDQALLACESALDLDPDLAEAHNLRGVILEDLDRNLEAAQAYRQALHLQPDFSDAKENLAVLEADLTPKRGLVTIATFSYPTEAHIFRTKLEAEDVWSFVADEHTVTMNWLYSNAIGGVKLQVRAPDVAQALEVLNQPPAEIEPVDDLLEEADEDIRCPHCQSDNVHYDRYATRLIFLSWLLLSFPIPFMKRRWKCEDCGHGWKPL